MSDGYGAGSAYFDRTGAPAGVWYDVAAADRAQRFIETFPVQSKGEWAGMPLELAPWQRTIVRDIFGWKTRAGFRQFRSAYVEIPRKNGKSTLASAIAVYLLIADGEPGAQVYCAAKDTDQADIVFGEARAMVEESPTLARRVRPFKRSLVVPSTRSRLIVLSGVPEGKTGFNSHGIIFDEFHEQSDRLLYDVLRTSTGSRRQPLLLMLTTAGYDRLSPCWEQHERSRQTMADPLVNPSHYGVIFAASEQDDWQMPSTWARANPNLGVSKALAYMEEAAREAQLIPGMLNAFLRLELNIWTTADVQWLDMALWDQCQEEDAVELAGRACYGGLDLASNSDMASFALVFPPDENAATPEPYRVRIWYWIPGANVDRRAQRAGVPYDVWRTQGLLAATPGNVIDYDAILEHISELGLVYDIREIAFDRWGAVRISQQFMERGFTMVEFGQGYASMAAPMREIMRMVSNGELAHDGHPILRWNVENVVATQDDAGQMKPSKKKALEKIDGFVAMIMALDRALKNEGGAPYYAQEGLAVA
jgi:phage terminase large subunit-like protein